MWTNALFVCRLNECPIYKYPYLSLPYLFGSTIIKSEYRTVNSSQKVDAILWKTHQPLLSYPYDWHCQCWLFHLYCQQHLYTVNCSIAWSYQWHRQLCADVNASTKCEPHNTPADLKSLIKYRRISATVALHHSRQLKNEYFVADNKMKMFGYLSDNSNEMQ